MIYSYCMNVYFALILNFLPLLACLFSFKFFFKLKFSTELFAGLLGLLAVLPATFLQFYFTSLAPEQLFSGNSGLSGIFLKFLLLNGLAEELIKTVLIAFIPRKNLDLRRFFLASLIFGLCLGSFESMIYFLCHLSNANQSGAELLYSLIFARMFSSDLIHAFCAGLDGLFVWGICRRKINPMIFVYAVVCHGLFNFFVYFDLWIHWFAVPAVFFAVVECRVKYQKFALLSGSEKPNSRSRSVRAKPETRRKSAKKSEESSAEKVKSGAAEQAGANATVVSECVKSPAKPASVSKRKTNARSKTKIQLERKSSARKRNISDVPEDIDVTPELNDDL